MNDDRTLPVDADVLDELRQLADQLPAGRPGERSVGSGGSVEQVEKPEPVVDLRSGAVPAAIPPADHTTIVDDMTTDALRALADRALTEERIVVSPAPPAGESAPLIRGVPAPPPTVRPIGRPASPPPPTPPPPPDPSLAEFIATAPTGSAPSAPPMRAPDPGRWMPPERVAAPIVHRAPGRGFRRTPHPVAVIAALAVTVAIAVGVWLVVLENGANGGLGGEISEDAEFESDGDG